MPHETDIEREVITDAEIRLVDLLYGELDEHARVIAEREIRANEALGAEYEALVELRSKLSAMREEEPPAAATAKLLHAAAVHAPAQAAQPDESGETRGFWEWMRELLRPVMMYPGLTAAASLLVVVGIAGVLYVKNDGLIDKGAMSESSADAPRSNEAMDSAAEALAPEAVPETDGADETAAADGFIPGAEGGDGEGGGEPTLAREELDEAATAGELNRRAGSERRARRQRSVSGYGGRGAKASDGLVTDLSISGTTAGPSGAASRGVPGGVMNLEDRRGDADDDAAGEGAVGASRGPAPRATSKPAARPSPDPAPAPPSRRPATVAKGKADEVIEVTTEEPRLKDIPADAPAQAEKPREPAKKKPERADSSVRSLHEEAVIAARNGQCDAVADIGNRIRRLDRGYYDRYFARDAKLARCRKQPVQRKK